MKLVNAKDLSRESDVIASSKVEEWKRDRLEKEYKVLFFKTREISALLQEEERKTQENADKCEEALRQYQLMKNKYKETKGIIHENKQEIAHLN